MEIYSEIKELKIYIRQLEEENSRLKLSQKSLKNNNRVLLDGNKKLMSTVNRLRKERNVLIEKFESDESDISEEGY